MASSNTRSALEKFLFENDEARLIKAVEVSRLDKKRKTYSLCLSISRDKTASISVFKCIDKQFFRCKYKWSLKDLHMVDGKDASRECNLFDLHFDKVYRWMTATHLERNVLIANLWMMYSKQHGVRHHVNTPPFVNVPQDLLQPSTSWQPQQNTSNNDHPDSENGGSSECESDCGVIGGVLSAQEESDLLMMMSECDGAALKADSFAELLSRDLSVLDGANVQSIMSSEQQVESLMDVVQQAIDQLASVQQRLDAYDNAVVLVRRSLREMEREKSKLQLTHGNQKRLLVTLEHVLPELTHRERHVLSNPDLTSPDGVHQACAAAASLSALSQSTDSPTAATTPKDTPTDTPTIASADPLHQLASVAEQRRLFDKLSARFSHAVVRYISNLFVHMGNNADVSCEKLSIPDHSECHAKLQPYAALVHWARDFDNRMYLKLLDVYENAISKRYERELSAMFAVACTQTGVVNLPNDDSSESGGGGRLSVTASGTLSRVPSQIRRASTGPSPTAAVTPSIVLLTSDVQSWKALDEGMRWRFDKVLRQLLAGLQPAFVRELHFCADFFQLNASSASTVDDGDGECIDSVSAASASSGGGASSRGSSAPTAELPPRLSQLMSRLFSSLQADVSSFILVHERADPLCTMHVLVVVSQLVNQPSPPPTMPTMMSPTAPDGDDAMLRRMLVCVQLTAKQSLDRLMHAHIEAIEQCSAVSVAAMAGGGGGRRARCGILPFVVNFEHLLRAAEAVFCGSVRHGDWHRWRSRLLHAIVHQITVVGEQHAKTPLQVVEMENLHHLHAMLMRVKLSELDSERRDIKHRYNTALKAYVVRYFGQPLIKLNEFFDGVQQCVSQGVRESEVGYQMAFSKQALRKLLHEYPGSEVQHGLEQLYKKVDKHLCVEENLLQVVWRAIQEEFLSQYKSLEDMIQRCYPGSLLTLEFTIEDLLGYFSEIARQH